jgi:hypothetical protein
MEMLLREIKGVFLFYTMREDSLLGVFAQAPRKPFCSFYVTYVVAPSVHIRGRSEMQLLHKSRIVWAIVAIAILLVNPAGICAGTPGASSPSHPCCPKPAATPTSSCVCIDRQPAAPVLPSLADSGPVLTVAPAAVELDAPAVAEFAAFDLPAGPPQDLSVSFHQLLL